jgi:hypothetical protein
MCFIDLNIDHFLDQYIAKLAEQPVQHDHTLSGPYNMVDNSTHNNNYKNFSINNNNISYNDDQEINELKHQIESLSYKIQQREQTHKHQV